MNYTEKYHLPQWEENDRVMRTDFNQMCANIESGIDGAKAQAAQSDAALDRKTAAAQVSADSAQAAADAAQQTALEYRHYVLGHYWGMSSAQTISIGFKPIALMITNLYGSTYFFLPNVKSDYMSFTDDGFSLVKQVSDAPNLNYSPVSYYYLALR